VNGKGSQRAGSKVLEADDPWDARQLSCFVGLSGIQGRLPLPASIYEQRIYSVASIMKITASGIVQLSAVKKADVGNKVDKEKFDALLTRLLRAKPAPKSTIKTSRKKKVGKIIPSSSSSQ
jgi:hypothetical protein